MIKQKDTINLSIPKGAIFSDDRKYRYALWRVWSNTRPLLLLIGLNPSSANEINDDPTITRGIVRANRNGFGGLLMGNLYAYVSTNPEALLKNGESIGALNDYYLKLMISMSGRQLCGWGSFKPVIYRASAVYSMLPNPVCLGVNADGQPKHPLYISYHLPTVRYSFSPTGGE